MDVSASVLASARRFSERIELLDLEDTRGVDGLAKTVSTSRPVLDPLLHEGDRGQLMLAASVMIRSR
jgi:hypothetical protein